MGAKILTILSTIALFSVSACNVPRPEATPGLVCGLRDVSHDIDVDLAPATTIASTSGARSVEARETANSFFYDALERVQKARERKIVTMSNGDSPRPITQLVLSGGGQEGAFGTGLLKGASDRPDFQGYDVVTGVSTGALQATFALLGKAQYTRPPFVGDFPPRQPGATAVDDLVSGYTISRADSLFENHGEIAIIRRAAQGNFRPLTARIRELLQPQVFKELSLKAAENRQLYVALLNWDSGRVVAVDMMALAERHKDRIETLRTCFTQVLVAASSEPLAVPPVNIDGTLYMDAGLRFGVFGKDAIAAGDRLAAKFAAKVAEGASSISAKKASDVRVRSDVIVNGRLEYGYDDGSPPARYNALDVAGQARRILVTQIYRFSVADVMRHGPGHATRLAYIDPPLATDVGKPATKPFDPAYMKRLIAAGRKRGAADDWTLVCEPAEPCVARPTAVQK